MNTTSILIYSANSCFICYDVICFVLVVSIYCILFKYIGKSNKEIVFYKEKFTLMYGFFLVHMLYFIYLILKQIYIKNLDVYFLKEIIDKIYLYFVDYYIMIIFLLNLFISVFIYSNIQDPSHLLIEVIKQPKHIKYEIIILISCFIKVGLDIQTFKKLEHVVPIVNFVYFGLILIFTFLYIHLSKKMLRLYSFNFKDKFISVLNSNRIINIPYTLVYISKLMEYILPKNEKQNKIYLYILNFFLITSHLIDCISFLFQIYLSDSYYFLISKSSKLQCLFCLFKKTHPNIHKIPLITNSDFDYKFQASFFNSSLISSENLTISSHRKEMKFEQLGEFLQKKNYSINSYYIELLDFIINTSIVSIVKLLNYNFSNNDNNNDEDSYITFTKKNNNNDFQNNNNLNQILELSEFQCDYNLKIKQNFSQKIHTILNNKKIHINDIIYSLLSHYEKNENDSIYQNSSLLIKNILEENFNQMKGLSLKTTDKRLYIDILSNHNNKIKQDKLKLFINDYLDYINENNDSFLPIILGVFNVKVNNFNELIFILSSNSLNQNTPINNINTYYSTYNIAFPIKQNTERKSKFKIKSNFNEWKSIIEKDIDFLSDVNISSFELEGLYYREGVSERNNDIIRSEKQDELKDKWINFVKGSVYKVQHAKFINNMHFQFKSIFDLDNLALIRRKSSSENIRKYDTSKREVINLFQYESNN